LFLAVVRFGFSEQSAIRLRGSQMAEYRIHVIGTDDQFLRSIEFICTDDESAKSCARKIVQGHDLELWQGERKISTFKHSQK
jgi:hypothetical protein